MEKLDSYVYNKLEEALLTDRNYVTSHKHRTEETKSISIDSGVKLVIHPQQTQRVDGYFAHCRFTLSLTGERLDEYLPVLHEAIEDILSTPYGEDDINDDVWMPELERDEQVMGSAFGYYQAAFDEIVEATIVFDNGGEEDVYVTQKALDDDELLEDQLFNWWWPQLRESQKQELVFESNFDVKTNDR